MGLPVAAVGGDHCGGSETIGDHLVGIVARDRSACPIPHHGRGHGVVDALTGTRGRAGGARRIVPPRHIDGGRLVNPCLHAQVGDGDRHRVPVGHLDAEIHVLVVLVVTTHLEVQLG